MERVWGQLGKGKEHNKIECMKCFKQQQQQKKSSLWLKVKCVVALGPFRLRCENLRLIVQLPCPLHKSSSTPSPPRPQAVDLNPLWKRVLLSLPVISHLCRRHQDRQKPAQISFT